MTELLGEPSINWLFANIGWKSSFFLTQYVQGFFLFLRIVLYFYPELNSLKTFSKACIGEKITPSLQEETALVFNSQHLANKSTLTDPLIQGLRLGSLCVACTPAQKHCLPTLQMTEHELRLNMNVVLKKTSLDSRHTVLLSIRDACCVQYVITHTLYTQIYSTSK